MSRLTARKMSLLAACGALSTATLSLAAAESATVPATVPAHWQHQSRTFSYQGFTSYYTCDGLEDKVKQILVYFGARKDAKVRASGCAYGPNRPSPYAFVNMEFDTLTTASAPAAGGGATEGGATEQVNARWQPVELASNRPHFMGSGECELIEQLKPVLTVSFAVEGLDYTTRCIPHQITLGDYSVHGRVLQAAPDKK